MNDSNFNEYEWICTTQETLGSLIKTPQLSSKLLARPPFRFIHDIVMEVIRVTGFGAGRFSEYESNSANITVRTIIHLAFPINNQDRESKIAFLEKLIDIISEHSEVCDVYPSKIVAGQDPERTNYLLVSLSTAALSYKPSRPRSVRPESAHHSRRPSRVHSSPLNIDTIINQLSGIPDLISLHDSIVTERATVQAEIRSLIS